MRTKLALVGLLIALLAVIPFFATQSVIYLLGLTFIFVVFVISWDLIAGYAGQVNLGHTVFIGIGAYTTALLQNPERFEGFLDFLAGIPQLPIWVTIIIGGLMAVAFGFIIGAICLRLKGYYLALVTAILPLICIQFLNVYSDVFGGYEGFSIGFGKALASDLVGKYYIALAFMIISIVATVYIIRSPLGIKLKAIREDEELAEAIGIDVVKYKLVAFCLSAFFAGLAGAMMVHYRITVGPDLFDVPLMLMIILSAVIGGLGSIYGPVAGAFLIYLAKNYVFVKVVQSLSLNVSDEIFLYILLIVIILKSPEGIFEKVRKFVGGIRS